MASIKRRFAVEPDKDEIVLGPASLQRSAQGLSRAQLRSANVKTLRHSYASGLIAAGGPITEVQHRLGHLNPAVTLKVYSRRPDSVTDITT
jgi:integrase